MKFGDLVVSFVIGTTGVSSAALSFAYIPTREIAHLRYRIKEEPKRSMYSHMEPVGTRSMKRASPQRSSSRAASRPGQPEAWWERAMDEVNTARDRGEY